jgi:hypothetical protein
MGTSDLPEDHWQSGLSVKLLAFLWRFENYKA